MQALLLCRNLVCQGTLSMWPAKVVGPALQLSGHRRRLAALQEIPAHCVSEGSFQASRRVWS